MPVYTFKCPRCKTVEERRVAMKDRDTQVCGRILPTETTTVWHKECEKIMVREGVELTSRTPGMWS